MRYTYIIICVIIILIICVLKSNVVEHLTSGCIQPGSLKQCQQCLDGTQCESNSCCPYMKKCISKEKSSCDYPIANCKPDCYYAECKSGQCNPTNNTSYPDGWQSPTCTGSEVNNNGSNSVNNTTNDNNGGTNSESSIPAAGSNSSGSNESTPSSVSSLSLVTPPNSEYDVKCSCKTSSN